MSDQLPVRVRFAPSPTGELHLGVARTALYDYLFARHTKGTIVFRVEDTDQKRYVPGSMDRLIADIQWLGIQFDEGPIIQSEQTPRHQAIAHELVARGAAYYDFSSPAEIGARSEEEYRARRTAYRSPDRSINPVEAKQRVDAGESCVVRLKVPETGTIVVNDLVRGRVEFDLATIDDAVLLKSDGFATYHLAAMVDDHDMRITHILRAEEWLPSTPKHLLIFQAMGWESPQFVHLSQILASDGKKLSKRIHGEAVWIGTYRKAGYLPEALINYLALLGWNPGGDRELMSKAELIESFSIKRLHKAGAVFDQPKLDSFQRHYVKQLSVKDLITRLGAFLDEQGLEKPAEPQFGRLVVILHDRLGHFAEFPVLTAWAKDVAEYSSEQLVFRKSNREATAKGLSTAIEALEAAAENSWESTDLLSTQLAAVVADQQLTNGDVFWPVRMALTGLDQSPSPAECLWVLGREESLSRLTAAISKF